MLRSIDHSGRRAFAHDPALRGFQPLYHPGEVNRCPGCGRTHWFVGRLSAECGFCATAIAMADTGMRGAGVLRRPLSRAA
ncbi:hypothetical protein [Allosphingosinicella sp.]|jgi:uncharacterized protein (DUF983 family)|uniref:hypothetical protein n=1 Tax=Allosphingosinicella sp. TaxID=2823234 RepID=UPI002EF4A135